MKSTKITLLLSLLLVAFSAQTQLKKPTVQPKKETTAKPQVKVVERVKIVEKDNDRDGDGIIDSMDKCPDEWGEIENGGCPSIINKIFDIKDSNGDTYNYEGEVKNGLPNGKGKALYNETGNSYIGGFENGQRSGFGTFTKFDSKYEGYWKNDKRDGHGVYTSYSITYSGEWKNDMYNGFGTYTITYDTDRTYISNCPDCIKYVGNWIFNKKNGHGQCFNKHGSLIYNGEFKNDKPIDNN